MAWTTLYIDTYSGDLVVGPSNNTAAPMPRFTQGDTMALRICLLARTTTYPASNPFSVINNSALSLRVAIGPKTGTAGSTLYTQQYTWDRDSNNQFFTGTLSLNTAAIASAIGSAESVRAWFEVEMTEGGYRTTVLQKQIDIHAEVIEEAAVVTPAGATVITAEEANATFLKNENKGFVLVCPDDDSIKAYVWLDSTGALQVSPIT